MVSRFISSVSHVSLCVHISEMRINLRLTSCVRLSIVSERGGAFGYRTDDSALVLPSLHVIPTIDVHAQGSGNVRSLQRCKMTKAPKPSVPFCLAPTPHISHSANLSTFTVVLTGTYCQGRVLGSLGGSSVGTCAGLIPRDWGPETWMTYEAVH